MAARGARQRGHVEERAGGSFRVSVYAGLDPLTHKRRYLRETASTRRKAQKALTRLQTQVDDRRHPQQQALCPQCGDCTLCCAYWESAERHLEAPDREDSDFGTPGSLVVRGGNDIHPMKTETGSACSSAGNAYETNNASTDRTRTIARRPHAPETRRAQCPGQRLLI